MGSEINEHLLVNLPKIPMSWKPTTQEERAIVDGIIQADREEQARIVEAERQRLQDEADEKARIEQAERNRIAQEQLRRSRNGKRALSICRKYRKHTSCHASQI